MSFLVLYNKGERFEGEGPLGESGKGRLLPLSRLKTFANFLVVSIGKFGLEEKVLDISQNFGLSTQCTGVKLKSYTGVKSCTEVYLTSETPIPHFPFTCHSSIQGLEAHLGLGPEPRLASNNTQLFVHQNS